VGTGRDSAIPAKSGRVVSHDTAGRTLALRKSTPEAASDNCECLRARRPYSSFGARIDCALGGSGRTGSASPDGCSTILSGSPEGEVQRPPPQDR
jgi:hypothetical protein